ncbi:alpha-1,2-Mannosidase [Mycena sanguinolenta]|uniref:alpha-1,2-Mannosidase n=1 Tax=Mycena sanguinolenta TaxID=230812 RepID=A0A8H6Y6L7_9AGAR|nr:alpha-1,2-Mannosidase [Mycena sanguinolenta]
MKWQQFWPPNLFALLLVSLEGSKWINNTNASPVKSSGWTNERKLAAREQTRSLWYHGFNSYMSLAFPLDELRPLSCTGQGPDWDHPNNYAANDVAGNFSLTLVDVLDTLVVLNDRFGFEQAVKNVIDWVSFDVNTRPQVFETTIRVLGGLLSGHIFASQEGQPFFSAVVQRGASRNGPRSWQETSSCLFNTHWATVRPGKKAFVNSVNKANALFLKINLRHGVLKGEGIETCSAGAGSLLLEFGTLSRLTGDDRFEKAAYKAFFAIWNRRSDLGLVGNTINIRTGTWTTPEVSGIGAGIDSFHEYALKWYIMSGRRYAVPSISSLNDLSSGDIEFLDAFEDSYAAIMRWSRAPDGFWVRTLPLDWLWWLDQSQYRPVNMNSGDTAYFTVDSLSAFWPGLQVLAGDVQNAIKLHMMYYNLWRKHSGLPEVYDTNAGLATTHHYPLRPELIESTWYLYRATRDPFYLDVGERILFDITTRAKVPCGLTGIKDLRTNSRDDRMESFALSETLKYLFLLFDEENPLHDDDSNYVFTTEGHLLTLDRPHLKPVPLSRRKRRKIDTHQCPAYHPVSHAGSSGLTMGIRSRGDVEYARELLAHPASDVDQDAWSESGWCERPLVNLFAYDFVLSASGKAVPEDLSPSRLKLDLTHDGFIIHNVTGIRIHIVQRLDGKGYDIRKLGHYDVRAGHTVYINDSSIFSPADPFDDGTGIQRALDLPLRFFTQSTDTLSEAQAGFPELLNMMDFLGMGYTALFWPGTGLPVYRDDANTFGCVPYAQPLQDAVIVVQRGECTFLQKLLMVKNAGAAGVLVVSDEDMPINPTADAKELEDAGDLSDIARRSAGGQVVLQVDPERFSSVVPDVVQEADPAKVHKILYLNGHPLLNTQLLF